MPVSSDLQLEIGHVLLIEIAGYLLEAVCAPKATGLGIDPVKVLNRKQGR